MTAQIHEVLILNGEKTSMAFCPPLPFGHPRMRELSLSDIQAAREARGRRSKDAVSAWDIIDGSTACWRRYQAIWQVQDAQFLLVAIAGRFELIGEGPLLADWFTGVLRVPRGAQLAYVHMGFGSVYEEELHIQVERGRVTGRRTYDNRGRPIDTHRLGWENLPGNENRFPGDSDLS